MQNSHDIITRTVKGLSLSAIEKAKSGHTSFPLGMADVGFSLFYDKMNYNPKQSNWLNRDRLVLSSGHGSMFIYSFLYLMGYQVTLDDIKNFRQIDSLTPGHPEFGHTEGVECTTGPLGQGVANAVGMALSEEMCAAEFNTDEFNVFDHYTYCLCGDGDLMEGVAMEAVSLAGHLNLKKLITIYDYNEITIDGRIDITYSEDVTKKFEAQNWHVQTIDGHNLEEIGKAIDAAKKSDKPSLIIAKTVSGKGAVNWEGTNKIHGNPMKAEDYDVTFKSLDLDRFQVPSEAYDISLDHQKKLQDNYDEWTLKFKEWHKVHPENAERLNEFVENDASKALDILEQIDLNKSGATRSLSGEVINAISDAYPHLVGGSADLAGSNNTTIKNSPFINSNEFSGKNINFGIREHAMGAIMNGIAYYGVLRPYGGTFLVFSDYMRPAARLAALANLPVVYIWTHDSFYVGEDGPTHHPVEHISSLRLIPNLVVLRPADGQEVVDSWKYILKQNNAPVALCLTRQSVNPIPRDGEFDTVEKGAYIVKDSIGEPELIIVATGSEVSLALNATVGMPNNKDIRIVSAPSLEIFEQQSDEYKASVFPSSVTKRYAVEAGRSDIWWKYVGLEGKVYGMDHFSESAPAGDLADKFGFTAEKLRADIEDYLESEQTY